MKIDLNDLRAAVARVSERVDDITDVVLALSDKATELLSAIDEGIETVQQEQGGPSAATANPSESTEAFVKGENLTIRQKLDWVLANVPLYKQYNFDENTINTMVTTYPSWINMMYEYYRTQAS